MLTFTEKHQLKYTFEEESHCERKKNMWIQKNKMNVNKRDQMRKNEKDT